MKLRNLALFLTLFTIATGTVIAGPKTGDEVIAAMRKKYDGKWYKTLTFKQNTITHKPDGTTSSETWYEALSAPGRLRIDIDPADKGNGILFTDGKIYSFKDGKTSGGRPFVHPLLILGFDVYFQDAAVTSKQLRDMGVDTSVMHIEKWQGRDNYVIGAKQGDMKTPQFWVDKKDLVFTRLFQAVGRDKKNIAETQFNKYYKVKGGGWVSPEVLFFVDGKPTTTEIYSEVRTGMTLGDDLYDPEKWMTVDRNYWKAN